MTNATNKPVFATENALLLARVHTRAEGRGEISPLEAEMAYDAAIKEHGETAVLKAILAYTDAQRGTRHGVQVLSERLPLTCSDTGGRPAHQLGTNTQYH